ncbi:MAG: AraC family transcriptional regulator [Turicibacter sp.]
MKERLVDVNLKQEGSLNYDLSVCYYGEEICEAGHRFGPAIRTEYLIHYVVSGKGKYFIGDKQYEVSAKQGFLIHPQEMTVYEADKEDPWHYLWIGFKGTRALRLLEQANLSQRSPVFTYDKDMLLIDIHQSLLKVEMFDLGKDSLILGYLYQWLGILIGANGHQPDPQKTMATQDVYFKEAVIYIHQNYHKEISVMTISDYLGIDRSYLYQIFKKQTHLSPSDFLIDYRLTKACELLKITDLPINQIAESVGYKDPLTFSKMFKKRMNKSPLYFRREEFGSLLS